MKKYLCRECGKTYTDREDMQAANDFGWLCMKCYNADIPEPDTYYLYKDMTAYSGKGKRYFVDENPCLERQYSGYRLVDESADKAALEEMADQRQGEYDAHYAVFLQRLSGGDRYCIDHPDKSRWDSMHFIFEGTLEECQGKLAKIEEAKK